MPGWSVRRWVAAVVGAVVVGAVTGLPTDLVPNPVFGRMTEPERWQRPAWALTAVLAGLLLATYVRDDAPGLAVERGDRQVRRASWGGVLSYLAVGCPVCNKLVVLALGASGATAWFAPLQPLLAALGVVLLAVALRTRLQAELVCAVPGVGGGRSSG